MSKLQVACDLRQSLDVLVSDSEELDKDIRSSLDPFVINSRRNQPGGEYLDSSGIKRYRNPEDISFCLLVALRRLYIKVLDVDVRLKSLERR